MLCPNCNVENLQDTTVCKVCGKELIEEQKQTWQGKSILFFKSKKFWIIITLVVLVLLIFFGAFLIINRNNDVTDVMDETERKGSTRTVDAYGRMPTSGEDYEAGQIVLGLKNNLVLDSKIGSEPISINSSISSLPSSLVVIFRQNKIEKISRPFKNSEMLAHVYILYFPQNIDVLALMTDLQKDPNIEFAEPDYYARLNYTPPDPYFSSKGSWGQDYDDLWNLKLIDMPRAWDITKGDASVIVGVADGGIDHTHPDLSENTTPGWSGVFGLTKGLTGDCSNTSHGTHVAGIIGAAENSEGVVGVAPGVRLMPLSPKSCEKIPPEDLIKPNLSSLPAVFRQNILVGIATNFIASAYAQLFYKGVEDGVDIINFSSGVPFDSHVLNFSVRELVKKGTVFVTAAGNDSENTLFSSPSNNPDAIVVAAVGEDDVITGYSNFGPTVTVGAPGGSSWNILSTGSSQLDLQEFIIRGQKMVVGQKYLRMSGTSMATPHVTGLAALVKSIHPDWNSKKIKCAIILGAEDKGDVGFDEKYGYGRINAYKTLSLDSNLVTENCTPTADIESPVTNSGHLTDVALAIKGTVVSKDIDYWKLEYLEEGKDIKRGWQTIKQDSVKVEKEILGSWNTTGLKEGNYQIRLTVRDKSGAFMVDEVSVYIYLSGNKAEEFEGFCMRGDSDEKFTDICKECPLLCEFANPN